MPGCGMHSRPKLAEKARYNSLLKIKQTTITTIRHRQKEKVGSQILSHAGEGAFGKFLPSRSLSP